VVTQPANQTCTLSSNASGTITANVTVTATCKTNTYKISVAVTGLSGTLKLQDNDGATLTFTTNKTQTFSTSYSSGSTYSVTITSQPSGQTCTLGSNASGTITSNITVNATCSTNGANYTISVAVTGLTGTLVVQDSKSDQLTFTTNTTQTFATSYASGSTYSVTILTQPAGQTCTLSSNASGTITSNITVTATCTTNPVNYTISVAVTGLTGTLVVQDSKSDQLTFTTNTTQTFATSYASGSTYTVTVLTQPAGQTCTLSSNASGTITSNITVTATCSASLPTISVSVTGLSGTMVMQDDQGATLTFTSNTTQTFSNTYASGATYTIYITSQPTAESCIPTYSTGTITSSLTIDATCATGATRQLGTISNVSSVSCQGYRFTQPASCQQMTVSCPNVPDVQVYLKTNTPTPSIGTVTWNDGTDGNGLYDSIFTYAAQYSIQPVLNAGYTTVQIDWGTPFNSNQPDGWVLGPGGVLAAACRYATVTQWIYTNIQNNTSLPYCATGNSGGAGVLAYALSQYNSGSVLSMAEVTSGPPTARLDWGCGCQEGKLAVQCGTATTLGTCFGNADAPVWDPAYNPAATTGVCTDAVNGTLPPGGLNFFLGDSAEAPGALYNFPNTFVNVVFGDADNSSAIPIGQDWLNNITTSKAQACVAGGVHSLPNTIPGAADRQRPDRRLQTTIAAINISFNKTGRTHKRSPRFLVSVSQRQRAGATSSLVVGYQDRVNHVDHAVGSHNVGLHHARIVDHHRAANHREFQFLAAECLRRRQFHRLRRGHIARYYVVEQDGPQLLLVLRLQKRLDRPRRQFVEGLVRGSKHGEGPFAFQSVRQSGGLKCGHQRGKRPRGDRDVNDVLFLGSGGHRHGASQHAENQCKTCCFHVYISLFSCLRAFSVAILPVAVLTIENIYCHNTKSTRVAHYV